MTDGNKADDKNSGLLMSVAETIGSTLGSLAAKAGAAQKSIGETTSEVVRKVTLANRKVAAKKTKKPAAKKSSKKGTGKPVRSRNDDTRGLRKGCHSSLRAMTGVTCVGRLAGIQHSTTPMINNKPGTTTSVRGSCADTPQSWLAISLASTKLTHRPITS